MERIHGGDWAGFEREYGVPPLDFSASISPLGLPDGVRRAAAAALADCGRYPDPLCRELRGRLARAHGVPEDCILCGNGAADLIDRLALALRPRRALVTAPTFSEYGAALSRVGCQIRRWVLPRENGFRLTEEFLSAVTPELDLVILCEPNNPTGRTTDRALLEAVLERCDACGALLAVDGCFADFLDDPAGATLQGALGARRLFILRAFTKFYAMAGIRLGYCLCGDGALLEEMRRSGQPWPVSIPAQAAGAAALEETRYAAGLRRLIREQRPLLARALADCGCLVVPGEANYLLFFHPDQLLAQKLCGRGILIRSCADYDGLGPGWYRTAVRTAEENQRLAQNIKGCVS